MTPCLNCGQPFDAGVSTCPFCRAPRGLTGLAVASRDADPSGDRLARVFTESMLARTDQRTEDLLARDLAGPLAPSELHAAMDRALARASDEPSLDNLENMLAQDSTVALDGIALTDLIDRRGDDAKIIKKGLVFLRNKRWPEALEWWSLHRESLDPSRERLQLLLLLLEAFTHRLAGDDRRAAQVRARIVDHPLFKRMRT
jgi:hypothetical protein